MRLLFVDFETQGSDASTTNPTEVAALSRFAKPGGEVLEESYLINDPSYEPQTKEIVDITGITDEMLKKDGQPVKQVLVKLYSLVEKADYVLAHNREFDQTVYEKTADRFGVRVAQPKFGWICTIQDVPWAKKYRCKQLSHLAYDHGIIVPPDSLHRALDDVRLLSMLMEKYDFEEILKYRNTPWVTVFLNGVRPPWDDNGASNGLAKKLGFRWQECGDGKVHTKRWCKRLKETELEAEKAKTPQPFKLTRESE